MERPQPRADGKPRRRFAGLRREIALALLVKLVLVIAIKEVFFSHAPSRALVEDRLAERLSAAPSPHSRQSTMEQP